LYHEVKALMIHCSNGW